MTQTHEANDWTACSAPVSETNAPCPSCPWRREANPSGENIPGFNLEQMRRLENTVSADGNDGFFPIMACHASEEGSDSPCFGYVIQEGHNNINVRLLATQNRSVHTAMTVPSTWDLYDSYAEMREAIEAAQDGQNPESGDSYSD